MAQAAVEIIDLEKDRVAFGLERPKVMLFMRVIGVAKVIKDGDGLDDARRGLFTEAATLGVMTATPVAKFCRN